MSKKLTPWIGYPGSLLQNTFSEDLEHGYLCWDVDVEAKKHAVKFISLPNPKPFVTVDWAGNVESTYKLTIDWPKGCRFRIRSSYVLPASEAASLGSRLRRERNASEVVFKSDDDESVSKFVSASLTSDIRSLPSLENMLREYYSNESIDDTTWNDMYEVLSSAHAKASTEEDSQRGVIWTLKRLEFDNLYGFGPGNSINFEDKNGIVGIFGPNTLGKSSVVGSILYTLFNASDRDVSKNAFIVNSEKKQASATALVSVAGSDYEIKRQTSKVISRGAMTANTTLTARQLDGDAVDITGEQRPDTEKNLRKLIGNYEDFIMTRVSAQDDINRFLREGPTQRKAILSRFLGIDFLDKLYVILSADLTDTKSKLKSIDSNDNITIEIKDLEGRIHGVKDKQSGLEITLRLLDAKRMELGSRRDELQKKYDAQASLFEKKKQNEKAAAQIRKHLEESDSKLELKKKLAVSLRNEIKECEDKLLALPSWEEIEAKEKLSSEIKFVEQELKTHTSELERAKKISLKLLDVPCDDQFPSCVYIKDAHVEKKRLDSLQNSVDSTQKKIDVLLLEHGKLLWNNAQDLRANRRANESRVVDLHNAINKCEVERHDLELELMDLKERLNKIVSVSTEITDANLESALHSAVDDYSNIHDECRVAENEMRNADRELGRLDVNLTNLQKSLVKRKDLESQLRLRELLVNSFSRRGIPNVLLNKLLPALNNEMNSILDGVSNFRIFLRAEEDSNSLDIMIDYGDKKTTRPLELGSGMERMISSLALRVALGNLTTLPKTDFMIIDEGFGVLDESNAIACVTLLRSLKKWFRFVLVISHIDVIKDAVDHCIDIEQGPDGALVIA